MAIRYNPKPGTILICDFQGSIPPEINKRRPVVVLSSNSYNLCTVVPLSTTEPPILQKWHYLLHLAEPLPIPYDTAVHWVKCDIVNTVSFDRLDLPYVGKDWKGKRIYDIKTVSKEDFANITACVAFALFNIDLDMIPVSKHH